MCIFLLFGCAGSLSLRGFFSGCRAQVSSPVVARGLLITVAALAAERRLQSAGCRAQAAERVGFRSCGAKAQ